MSLIKLFSLSRGKAILICLKKQELYTPNSTLLIVISLIY